MTVVSRKIASIPARSASETWIRIVDLIDPPDTSARAELLAAAGVVASLVAQETVALSPIVVTGEGPRLRFYCIHGEEAIDGAHINEAPLPRSPLGSENWRVSLPCPSEDLSWVRASLERVSSRITARDENEEERAAPDPEGFGTSASIDRESFLRP